MEHEGYSLRVVAHFDAPTHAGRIAEPQATGSAGSPSRGSSVRLYLRVDDNKVQAARFEALGCPHTLAAADVVCADIEGRALADLADYDAGFLVEVLALPAEKLDIRILLEDAVRSAARQAN
ncbi:MAG: iron-sulfur cluster assembly scaffold protein [Proteobacteria bacterium]|nr:iron-sulfur cluster assembly scaffold protein [Pseudomonadota bacterium]